jgi:hypothetical protein
MRKITLSLLAAALLLAARADALAQGGGPAALPKSTSLPPAFSSFSAGDVLGRIFEGYERATGRVANIPNGERKPTLVWIKEARPWRAAGREHLVVLAELAGDDYQPGGLCGNCAAFVVLAVLRKEGDALALVAKQTPPASSALNDSSESDDPTHEQFAPLTYTGHGDLSLDLAPYKLNERETLLGVRAQEMWIPALTFTTTLQLYRIEGRRLREVFNEPVVDREYPDRNRTGRQAVVKTVSTLSPVPSPGGEFNDLLVSKSVFRCTDRDEDWDCNEKSEAVRLTGSRKELWRFNGERFEKAGNPGAGRSR